MRYVYLIVTIVVLASCGNQKIRFSRVQSKKQTVVIVDEGTRASIKSIQKSESKQLEEIASKEPIETVSAPADEVENVVKEVNSLPTEPESAIEEKQLPADDEKVAQALEAEKNAKRASGLLIAALPGYFLFLIPGLILTVIGAIYYHKAKRAQYISQKGQNTLQVARIFYIIDLVFGIAFLIGLTGIIINNFI